ncbi:MAG: hypothetical protein QXY40_02100 [Candidatus Methanomethylicia archaeon]
MVDDVKTVCEENRKLMAEARKVIVETYKLIASLELLSDFRRLIITAFRNMFGLDDLNSLSVFISSNISDIGVGDVIREVLEHVST